MNKQIEVPRGGADNNRERIRPQQLALIGLVNLALGGVGLVVMGADKALDSVTFIRERRHRNGES